MTGVSDHGKTPREPSARTWTRLGPGALTGLLAGGAALAVAELAAAAVRPQAGPVVAVGSAAIDRTPAAVKDWVIRTFGTHDKLVLQLGILAVLSPFALALGALAARHRRTGAAGVLLFGAVGAAAAPGRPDSTGATDAFPQSWGDRRRGTPVRAGRAPAGSAPGGAGGAGRGLGPAPVRDRGDGCRRGLGRGRCAGPGPGRRGRPGSGRLPGRGHPSAARLTSTGGAPTGTGRGGGGQPLRHPQR
ncbi:hypothetical protein STENM327S_05679 [Streptomyces tendae]